MTNIDVLFCSVPVSSIDDGAQWYSKLFGRDCDIVVNEREVMWRLADSAWLYVIEDTERAGNTLVTLCVGDLDQALTDLRSRGLESGSIEIVGEAGRKATLNDPDGNAISFIDVTASKEGEG